MEILMSVMIGIIFTVSIYLFLSRSLLRVIFGSLLLSHGVHLLLMTMSELQRGAAPLLNLEAQNFTDPLATGTCVNSDCHKLWCDFIIACLGLSNL